MVVETFRYYAGGPERLLGDTIPVAGGVGMTFREPLGVVALITPWNFPLVIASWKLAPALAAGNTVVFKPAELTPLTALEFERIAVEAGLPEGVVNVVAGPGRDVRAAAGRASRRGQGRVHRLDRGRPLDRRGRRADDQARDARARRQVGQRRLRRRRHPGRRGGGAGRGVRQRGPGLLRALADPRRALGARSRSWTRSRRPSRRSRSATRSTRRREMGPLISAGQRETVASFVPDGAPVAIRGSAPDGPGYWFPPTVLCPVDPRRPRGARGDLRAGRGRPALPRRGGGDRARQRHDLRPLGLGLDPRRRQGAAGRARAGDRRDLDQLEHVGARVDAVRRLQAVGRRPRARARTRSTHYTEVKTVYYATGA